MHLETTYNDQCTKSTQLSLFRTKLMDLSGSARLLLGLRVNFQTFVETKDVQGHNVRNIVVVQVKAGTIFYFQNQNFFFFFLEDTVTN